MGDGSLLLFVVVEATNDCTNCDQASSNGDQGQQATGGGCCRGGWDTGKGFVDGCCGRKNSLSVVSRQWCGGDDSWMTFLVEYHYLTSDFIYHLRSVVEVPPIESISSLPTTPASCCCCHCCKLGRCRRMSPVTFPAH